jgi:hypothetical protein
MRRCPKGGLAMIERLGEGALQAVHRAQAGSGSFSRSMSPLAVAGSLGWGSSGVTVTFVHS